MPLLYGTTQILSLRCWRWEGPGTNRCCKNELHWLFRQDKCYTGKRSACLILLQIHDKWLHLLLCYFLLVHNDVTFHLLMHLDNKGHWSGTIANPKYEIIIFIFWMHVQVKYYCMLFVHSTTPNRWDWNLFKCKAREMKRLIESRIISIATGTYCIAFIVSWKMAIVKMALGGGFYPICVKYLF